MLHRIKLLNSENHTGEDVGDFNSVIRADFEDALVKAVEDTLTDNRLTPIRDFFTKWRREFPPEVYEMCKAQDRAAWEFVYYTGCELRRLQPRWEHCANKLKDQYGYPVNLIPNGQDFLLQ